jgi:IS30 family transposase
MPRGPRWRWTPAELNALWARWKAGDTFDAMGQAFGCSLFTIYDLIRRSGGVPPCPRRRSPRVLSTPEREEISRALAARESLRAIARRLGRAPSTISREIRRHGGATRYRAITADARAWRQARRPKRCRLATQPRLCRVVAAKLRADWAPQQIAAWLVSPYPTEPTMHVSHETIYRTLYIQARGALQRDLMAHLRRRRAMRRSGPRSRAGQGHHSVDAIAISARPPSVEDRAVPGHWEGDLLAGTKQSNMATLVERQSRYVVLVRLTARDTTSVVRALIRRAQHRPEGLMQSLTWDRGLELAGHKQFTLATDAQVYFCDPRSPWQRGSNENTNGLLRQYFPKGEDVSHDTQRQLDAIARKLNTRPRQTLHWQTPAQVFAATVALTD